MNIHAINVPIFDEAHYLPAARSVLAGQMDARTEHPPLAKLLIAAGIGLFGDGPLGWRVVSAIFGSLTLTGIYVWAQALFQRTSTALTVTWIAAFNQLLFVQSRIAMLDGFMLASMVWAFVALNRKNLVASGAWFGLAIACKWFGVIPLSLGFALAWNMRAFSPSKLIIFLGVLPVAAYFSVFLFYAILTGQPVTEIFVAQAQIWEAQQRVPDIHPYMSSWWSWPLMLRPIWYAFESTGADHFRGIFLIGNPVVLWGGIPALGFCAWHAWKRKSKEALQIVALYLGLWLAWVVIPRKLSFFYYYVPAAMMLPLALGFCFHHRPRGRKIFVVVCALVFAGFYPVLAGLTLPLRSLSLWTWLSTWI